MSSTDPRHPAPRTWPQVPDPGLPPLPEPLPRPEPASPLVWPARAVALVVMLPLRAVWEALAAALRGLEWLWDRCVMRPLAALGRLVWRLLLAPLGRALLVPLRALWRAVLRPVLVGLAVAVTWLCTYLVVLPLTWLWQRVLAPAGRGLLTVLTPVGRVLAWAWRTSGRILAALWRWFTAPFRWLYRAVLAPVGRALRAAWRTTTAPIRSAWRGVSEELSRMFGSR